MLNHRTLFVESAGSRQPADICHHVLSSFSASALRRRNFPAMLEAYPPAVFRASRRSRTGEFQRYRPDRIRIAGEDRRRHHHVLRAAPANFQLSIDSMFSDPPDVFVRLVRSAKILIVVLLATAIVSIIDLLWTSITGTISSRMSKQDVRIQSNRRATRSSKHASARCSRPHPPADDEEYCPALTLIIANPTHFAVAPALSRSARTTRYRRHKGRDLIALRIEIAEERSIPVFEGYLLHAPCLRKSSIDEIIPYFIRPSLGTHSSGLRRVRRIGRGSDK